MKDEDYAKTIHSILHIMHALLNARLALIATTGRQGIADDVRDLTAKLHRYALHKLTQALTDWPNFSMVDAIVVLDHAHDYAKSMYLSEAAAEHKLELLITTFDDGIVPKKILRAKEIHSQLLESTEKVVRAIDKLKGSASYAIRHQYIPSNADAALLNVELFKERLMLSKQLLPVVYRPRLARI